MPARRRADWVGLALAAAVAAGLLRSLCVTLATGDDPWIYRRLRVDGVSYIRGMEAVARRGPAAALEDPMHSLGYQAYLGTLLRALGRPERVYRVAKLAAWLLGALCALALYLIGESWGKRVGLTAALLLCWSQKWVVYANVLQYETLAACLLAAVACALHLRPRARSQGLALHGAAALALAAACWLHFRFLPCWAAGVAAAWALERRCAGVRRAAAVASLYAALLLAPVLAARPSSERLAAARSKALPLFSRLLRLANNPAALGYPLIGDNPKDLDGEVSQRLVEPSGAAFVAERPGRFLWLTAQRFLYIWDVKRDYWTAYGPLLYRPWRHPPSLAVLQACLLGLCAAGAALRLARRDQDARQRLIARLCAALLVLSLLPPLFCFGSSRYLVSVLPFVALFQAYGLVEAARIVPIWAKRRLRP